jgi:AraC family transcriptional activator of pobA
VEGLRLNRAARRLLEEAAPVSSIGYEVGFESPSYFTERFRRRFGTTPSEFRARADR